MAKPPDTAPTATDALAGRLGHRFRDPTLLTHALTHASATRAGGRLHSNERMEFLGDRVLALVIAEMLLDRFPEEAEGAIAGRFTALVRAETLTRIARAIDLGRHLILSKGEQAPDGDANPGVLADACEAVIAALYLDGGLAAAQQFIRAQWTPLLEETPLPPKDHKTRLQEWAQARSLPLPEYREVARSGPAHAPAFTVAVEIAGHPSASGQGPSKRAAEQEAAAALLASLEKHDG